MAKNFPKTLYLSVSGSGDDSCLAVAETEEESVRVTDDGQEAQVAEYQLVRVRRRQLYTTVIDAK